MFGNMIEESNMIMEKGEIKLENRLANNWWVLPQW